MLADLDDVVQKNLLSAPGSPAKQAEDAPDAMLVEDVSGVDAGLEVNAHRGASGDHGQMTLQQRRDIQIMERHAAREQNSAVQPAQASPSGGSRSAGYKSKASGGTGV